MQKSLVVGICLAVGIAGCGEGGPAKPKLYPVSGKVTVGGKPLTDCTISFSAAGSGPGGVVGYTGKLNANGEYTLNSADGEAGASAGKFKVTFAVTPEAAQKAMMSGGAQPGYEASAAPFPKEYATAETSPKEVEVKPEPNTINIDL